MRYYLDCEFFGLDGDLISLALVSEGQWGPARDRYDRELYVAFDQKELEAESHIASSGDPHAWVRENVLPIIDTPGAVAHRIGKCRADIKREWPAYLAAFFAGDDSVEVIADWPSDLEYLSRLLVTGPGTAIGIPRITMHWSRVDAYPTSLPGAVQHNALWDARALKHRLRP